MNRHERYLYQAAWTRELRSYLLQESGSARARRVLEVGCGTGAIQASLPSGGAQLHGLDLDRTALVECRDHSSSTLCITQGDALALPYRRGAFDITFCHFFLMWVANPLLALQEMKRVTIHPGFVIAFAEPDYGAREDRPAEFAWLGQRQNAALRRKGAALRLGAELASLFQQAGISIKESGLIRRSESDALTGEDWENEWDTIQSDLEGDLPREELDRMRRLDHEAVITGERVLHVPTYFAWGQV